MTRLGFQIFTLWDMRYERVSEVQWWLGDLMMNNATDGVDLLSTK